MKEERAIELLHVLRTGYICDPQECGLVKGGDVCSIFECDNFHEALVMAIDALENRIVARDVAANMVKTIRSGKDEYSDINRQND